MSTKAQDNRMYFATSLRMQTFFISYIIIIIEYSSSDY